MTVLSETLQESHANILAFHNLVFRSIPDTLGTLAMSTSLVDLATSAATGIKTGSLTDEFLSAVLDLTATIPESSGVESLETSADEYSVEQILTDHPELADLVGPDDRSTRTRIVLALFLLVSFPIVINSMPGAFIPLLKDCLFYLRVLGHVSTSDPAFVGILTLWTICRELRGSSTN